MKVGIVVNVLKPKTLTHAENIYHWLTAKAVEVVFQRSPSTDIVLPGPSMRDEELAELCDFIVVLGGDGTLLSAAKAASKTETPLLGVNLGDFGFLVSVEPEDVFSALERVLSGQYSLDKRMMLQAAVYRNGELIDTSFALNDVVVTKGSFSRLIRLEVFAGDQYIGHFPSDGIIVSSSTGSTAYNLSAGGPIVSPELNVIILTPICPHTLFSRPMVIPPGEEVRIVLISDYPEIMLTVDGQYGFSLKKSDEVLVGRAPFEAHLIKLVGRSFYDTVRRKLRKGESSD